ncbi:MAG: hypothetical protein JWN25_1554 [Verrucomicrobiales bacterium]|jgi:putative exosortase-associated protein (TIGR04073 family)|nr:hypothetical protein [Verrucomicrobiales bacterium]MDB6131715.1 hypothetical protein [Verrucomicrobiales bacterium]
MNIVNANFRKQQTAMRKHFASFASILALPLLMIGCAGPEAKLGRGINNITEFPRGGEIRRSMEQTAFFSSPDVGYTTGFIHGFNRSVARTFVGAYEIITFPIPSYDPIYTPVNPVYPDTYKPKLINEPMFQADSSIGFGGGDVAPHFPGSRFKIFDN